MIEEFFDFVGHNIQINKRLTNYKKKMRLFSFSFLDIYF